MILFLIKYSKARIKFLDLVEPTKSKTRIFQAFFMNKNVSETKYGNPCFFRKNSWLKVGLLVAFISRIQHRLWKIWRNFDEIFSTLLKPADLNSERSLNTWTARDFITSVNYTLELSWFFINFEIRSFSDIFFKKEFFPKIFKLLENE